MNLYNLDPELVSTCDELIQFRSRISVYLWWTYTIKIQN